MDGPTQLHEHPLSESIKTDATANGAAPEGAHVKTTNVLFLLNDSPYGSERTYNGIRTAQALSVRDDVEVRLFMFGDAVVAAAANQVVPKGFYNLGNMIATAARHGAQIGCCGTCLNARGITDDALLEGADRSTLATATDWILWADKVLTF